MQVMPHEADILITAADGPSANDPLGMGKLFGDPNLIGKLAANPKTSKLLADPSFVQQLQLIQRNPQLANSLLSQDPRMISVLGALMGIDMEGFARPEGSDELPAGYQKADAPSSPPPPQPSASTSTPKSEKLSPPPAVKVEEDVEMAEEDQEDAKAKNDAEAEKKLGAAAYKARDFANAASHFQKAWDIWPKDITFLSNLGGKSYVQCRLHGTLSWAFLHSCLLRARRI